MLDHDAITRLVANLIHTAEEAEKEYQDFQDRAQRDEDVLNEFEAIESAEFANGYAAGIRYALNKLTK